MVRFEVRKDSFQEKAGFRLERDKIYAISGEIGGVSSFRKVYNGDTESERMAFFASKESSESVRAGEKYDVRIRAIEEISKNSEQLGVFEATAYKVPGHDDQIRFDILTSSFEKRTGVRLEEGKIYEIRGTIGDISDFKVTRTEHGGDYLFVFAPRESADMLKPGEKYELKVLSVEEKRTLTVSGEGSTTRLTLQKRMLESLGVDVDSMKKADANDRVVEVTVKNVSSADKTERRIYGRMEPSEGALPLSISHAGGKHGDRFELVGAKHKTVSDFVSDFNKHKGDAMKNVNLSLEGKKLMMEVDGRRFEAKSSELDVWRLQVFLKSEFEPFKREIRFWSDGETMTPKFGQSWTIKSFLGSDAGLGFTYMLGDRQISTRAESSVFKYDRIDSRQVAERLVLSDIARSIEGVHGFKVDPALYGEIYGRLGDALQGGNSKYKAERGEIGEAIGVAILSKMGWQEVSAHPFSRPGQGSGSRKHGTDSLVRSPSGDLLLFEFKWWKDAEEAQERGIRQVEERAPREGKEFQGEQIRGAYIAVLDFSMTSRTGELHVERVW